jgi:hypothetical protein
MIPIQNEIGRENGVMGRRGVELWRNKSLMCVKVYVFQSLLGRICQELKKDRKEGVSM